MTDSFRGERNGGGRSMGYCRESESVKAAKKMQKFKKTTHPMETLGASRNRMAMRESWRVSGWRPIRTVRQVAERVF